MRIYGCVSACFGLSIAKKAVVSSDNAPTESAGAADGSVGQALDDRPSHVIQTTGLPGLGASSEASSALLGRSGAKPRRSIHAGLLPTTTYEDECNLAPCKRPPKVPGALGWSGPVEPPSCPADKQASPPDTACNARGPPRGLHSALRGTCGDDPRRTICGPPDDPARDLPSAAACNASGRYPSDIDCSLWPCRESSSLQSTATLATQCAIAAGGGGAGEGLSPTACHSPKHEGCGALPTDPNTVAASGPEEPYTPLSRHCCNSGNLQRQLPLPLQAQLPQAQVQVQLQQQPLCELGGGGGGGGGSSGTMPSPPRVLVPVGGQSPRLTVFPSVEALLADLRDLRLLRPAAAPATAASYSGRGGGGSGGAVCTGGRSVLVRGRLTSGAHVVVHLLGCRALHPATGPALRTVMIAGSAVHPAIARVYGMRFVPAATITASAVSGSAAGAAVAALAARGLSPGGPTASATAAAAPPGDWGALGQDEDRAAWLRASGADWAGTVLRGGATGGGGDGAGGAGGDDACEAGGASASSAASAVRAGGFPACPSPAATSSSIYTCASACCTAVPTSSAPSASTTATIAKVTCRSDWLEATGPAPKPSEAGAKGSGVGAVREQDAPGRHRYCPQLQPPAPAQQQQQQQRRAVAPERGAQRTSGLSHASQLAAVVAALQTQLQLEPGEGVLAVVCEGSPMGSLESLLGGMHNPFRPNRSWPAYLARRALLRTALEVAGALAHLHSSGFVHGALRPCNVLLVPASNDRRNYKTKVFGACVRFVQLLSNQSSAATLAPTGVVSKSTDKRHGCGAPGTGGGASGSVAAAVAAAAASTGVCPANGHRCASSPQPHISGPFPFPFPEGLMRLDGGASPWSPSCGDSPRLTASAAATPAASPLLSPGPLWSPAYVGVPYSPASGIGRSRAPSRVLTVTEEALSAAASPRVRGSPRVPAGGGGRYMYGHSGGGGSVLPLSLSLALASGSCPGRPPGSRAAAAAAMLAVRTPSEGQLLPSFLRAARRPLRTSCAIPEQLEAEAAELAEAAAGEGKVPAAAAAATDAAASRATDTGTKPRSTSELLLRNLEDEPTTATARGGRSSMSFTWGVGAGAGPSGPGSGGGGGGGIASCASAVSGTSAPSASSRLAARIRALVFNKPGGASSAVASAVPSPSAGSPRAGAGIGTGCRSVTPRDGAAAGAAGGSRNPSVALAAAALLLRRPSLPAGASPVNSMVAPEHETMESMLTAGQPRQRRRRRGRPGAGGEDEEEEGEGDREEDDTLRQADEDEEEEEEEQQDVDEGDDLERASMLHDVPAEPPSFHASQSCPRSLEPLPSAPLPYGLDTVAAAAAAAPPARNNDSLGGWRDELFLPPESQQDPSRLVDTSQDTWAFGMLLWAMVAGEPPLEGSQPLAPVLSAVPTSTSGPCPYTGIGVGVGVGILTTLDLDLGIRAPPWPARCTTHSYLQPLYEACVSKEPGSRPSLTAVKAHLEMLERQVRDEHERGRAAAAAAAATGVLVLDSADGYLHRHRQPICRAEPWQHQSSQQQQQWLQPQEQPAQLHTNASGRLFRAVHGEALDSLCRPRLPLSLPPHSPGVGAGAFSLALHRQVTVASQGHPTVQAGAEARTASPQKLHSQVGQSQLQNQHPQHQLQQYLNQCVRQEVRLAQQPQQPSLLPHHHNHNHHNHHQHELQGLAQQAHHQPHHQQQQRRATGLSRSLPTPASYIHARTGAVPL